MRDKNLTTITLNPCIDKTVTVEDFKPGALNRITSVRFDFSGKGINLSTGFKALGGQTAASGFMYADDAERYRQELLKKEIGYHFVEVNGRTRENVKVFDTKTAEITEINESGGYIEKADIDKLIQQVKSLAKTTWAMAFSGSLPPGVPADVYAKLATLAKSGGALTVLDCDGEALKLGLKTAPEIIKPNRFELEQLCGGTLSSEAEIARVASQLIETYGVRYAAVTLGAEGAMLVTPKGAYSALPLKLNVRSATGAGDSFVAGMLTALRLGLKETELLRWGMAAAGDAVTREGTQLCTNEGTQALLGKVNIKPL